MRNLFSLICLTLLPLLPSPARGADTEMMTVTGIEIGKPGGRLVVPSLGDPKSFNTVTANETSSTDVIDENIYEGLVYYNPEKKEIEPWLATSWEHSEDYLTWTFHLRKGVQWNDGAPLTADDVLFSFEVVYDESIINPAKSFLQVSGKDFEVTKTDEHTVQIGLASVYGPILRALADSLRIVPKHKLQAAYEAGTFQEALNVGVDPSEVVGTGPFKMKSFLSGERVILERNPNYWKEDENGYRLPYLDEIVFLNLPDLDSWDLAFEAGTTDVHGIVPSKYRRFKAMEKEGNFTIHDLGVTLGDSHFWFNQNTGKNKETGEPIVDPRKLAWFTNVKFRKAVSHCINRQGIIRNVFRGRAQAIHGPLSPAMTPWYNPDVPKFEYAPEKAKALLDEIEFIDRDGDGYREDPQGNKIEFTFITNRENDIREKIGVIIQDSFQKVGLDGRLKLVDFNTLVTAIADSYDYEACLLGLTGSDHPLTGLNVYRSSGRTHEWFPNQKTPATEWEAKVDALIEEFLATPEEDKQVEIWHEIQLLYAENQPMSWTVNPKVYLGVRNKFGNVRPQIMRPRLLWNVEEIFVK